MTSLKDLIAGMFVLVALLLFLVFLGWASDIKGLFADRKEATVLLRRAVPLAQGAPVRYEGIFVGDVQRVRLRDAAALAAAHPDYHVALDLSVAPDVPLTAETRVFVTADGLLGARFVDVRAARDGARPLAAGTPLLGVLGGVDSMLSRMDELTASLTALLDRLQRLLDPAGPRGSISHLLGRASDLTDEASRLVQGLETTRGQVDAGIAQARKMMNDAEPGVKDLLQRLASVSGEAQSTLADFRTILGDNRGKIGRVVSDGAAALARLTTTIDELGREAGRVLARADGLIARNDRNIFLTLHHLRVAAEELKLAMARVRADPSQVLWGGEGDPDAAEAEAKRSQERDLLDKGFLPPRWKR